MVASRLSLLLVLLLAFSAFAMPNHTTQLKSPLTAAPLFGATIYPNLVIGRHIYRGDAWMHPEFTTQIDQDIAWATQEHLNTLRATNFLDGALSYTNPTIWANMDYLLKQAATAQMHIVISLDAYTNFLKAHGASVLYDVNAWQPYVDFVLSRYRGNATIAYFAIAGEIPAVNSKSPYKLTADGYVAFYAAVGARIHYNDPHAIVGSGGLSYLNHRSYGIPWQRIFSLPDIQIACIHVYSQGDLLITLPMVSQWAMQNTKPWMLEEFGFRQALGDSVRAQSFAQVYSAAQSHQAIGAIFWNMGSQMANLTYDVNPQTPQTWLTVNQYAQQW